MKEELQKKLYEKYPLTFADKDKSAQESCMYWGIDTGDGWYDLIDDLCSKLEPLIEEWIKENPDGACVCGMPRNKHNGHMGKCTHVYRVPYGRRNMGFIVPKNKVKKFFMHSKSRLKNRINGILFWLCDKNILYKSIPSDCKKYSLSHPRAAQVKEKFGGLRFYLNNATNEMFNLEMEFEDKSYKICEVCGEEGKIREGGWVRTVCDKHHKKGG